MARVGELSLEVRAGRLAPHAPQTDSLERTQLIKNEEVRESFSLFSVVSKYAGGRSGREALIMHRLHKKATRCSQEEPPWAGLGELGLQNCIQDLPHFTGQRVGREGLLQKGHGRFQNAVMHDRGVGIA